jgi:hypothetical protein
METRTATHRANPVAEESWPTSQPHPPLLLPEFPRVLLEVEPALPPRPTTLLLDPALPPVTVPLLSLFPPELLVPPLPPPPLRPPLPRAPPLVLVPPFPLLPPLALVPPFPLAPPLPVLPTLPPVLAWGTAFDMQAG